MAPEMTVGGVPGATTGSLRTHPPVLALAGCMTAAVALGVLAELLGYLPFPWMYLSQVIFGWLVGAFASGACTRTAPRAAAAGAAFITVGLLSNTVFKALMSGRNAVRPMTEHEWPVWLALGLVLGGTFGVAGWVRVHGRGGGRAVAAAVIIAAGIAEVAANVLGVLPWGGSVALALAGLVAITAVLVLRGLGARQALLAALAVAVLAVAALLVLPVLAAIVSVA